MMTIRDLLSSHWSIYHQRSLLSVKIHWLSHDSFFFFFFVFFLILLLHFLLKPFTLNKSTCLVAHTQFCSRSMFRYQFGWRHLVIILTWLASVCVGFVYVGLYGGSQFRWSNLGFFFLFFFSWLLLLSSSFRSYVLSYSCVCFLFARELFSDYFDNSPTSPLEHYYLVK